MIKAKIRGPKLSRFGRVITFAPAAAGGGLLVSAPLANGNRNGTLDPTSPLVVPAAVREVGAIFGWFSAAGLPSGGVSGAAAASGLIAEKSASWVRVGDKPHGRLGSAMAVLLDNDVRHSATTTTAAQQQGGGGWVVAGAPLASSKVEMGGSVEVLALPAGVSGISGGAS